MGRRITLLEACKRDDDLFSYLFIDLPLYFDKYGPNHWYRSKQGPEMSRKMQRQDFKVPHMDKCLPILDVVVELKSGNISLKDASIRLRKMGPIGQLMRAKTTQASMLHAENHLNRYLELCLPDPGFRIFETHRYKQRTQKRRPPPEDSDDDEIGTSTLSRGGVMVPATMTALPEAADLGGEVTSQDMLQIDSGDNTPQPEENDKPDTSTVEKSDWQAPPRKPLDLGFKATRDYQVHEIIRLFGSAGDLTDAQDDEMRMDTSQLKADFSVLYNPTKNCFQILMGPSRFVNHDCKSNVELIRTGKGLCFKVVRPISAGEEIFSYYGSEYFGRKNRECRCYSCRKDFRGDFYHLLTVEQEEQRRQAKRDRKTRSGQILMEREKEAKRRKLEQEEETEAPRTRSQVASSSKATAKTTPKTKSALRQAHKHASTSASGKSADTAVRNSKAVQKRQSRSTQRQTRHRNARASKPSAGDDSDLTDVEELDFDSDTDLDGIAAHGEHDSDSSLSPPMSDTDESSRERSVTNEEEEDAEVTSIIVPSPKVSALHKQGHINGQHKHPNVIQSPMTEPSDGGSGSQIDA